MRSANKLHKQIKTVVLQRHTYNSLFRSGIQYNLTAFTQSNTQKLSIKYIC